MPRLVATGLSSWRTRKNAPTSGTAATAVYNSMWWFRGEREMRHTEAGCLMAPVLLLPMLGTSIPLPVHLSLVFVHTFVVVPFAAGIYPPRVLDAVKAKFWLCWNKALTVILTPLKLVCILLLVVGIRLFDWPQLLKYLNQLAFLHLAGVTILSSHSLPRLVAISSWSYLVCLGTFLLQTRTRSSSNRSAECEIVWAFCRSVLLLWPWVQRTCALCSAVVYLASSEVLSREEHVRNQLVRLAKLNPWLAERLLDHSNALLLLLRTCLPLASFNYWLQSKEKEDPFFSLVALTINVAYPFLHLATTIPPRLHLLYLLLSQAVWVIRAPGEFCSVCQSELTCRSVGALTTACGHTYHLWCLLEMIAAVGREGFKCPNCNSALL